MRRTTLRQLAAAALVPLASARPQPGITVARPPVVWVTVDDSGAAQTVTPGVITTEGHRATVSQAPASLVSTATHTLSPGGTASTYTGLAPVASATGGPGSPAGVFPACDANANVGPVEPFCLPRAGSELHPGTTYYITWSPSYFNPPTLPVSLQVRFSSSPPSESTPAQQQQQQQQPPFDLGHTAFNSTPLPASTGFFPWTVPSDFLTSRDTSRAEITFVLAYGDPAAPEDTELNLRVGPAVFVTPSSSSPSTGGGGGSGSGSGSDGAEDGGERKHPNLVTIVVPVVLGGGFLLLTALCFVSWRRTGRVPLVGGAVGKMRRRSAGGYGVRQSRGERMGAGGGPGPGPGTGTGTTAGDNKSETDVGIQLTDRDSWSPTGRGAEGRNVFREEVERQDRMR